ncbi:hypothetical protein HG536_0H00760 [Torulaspora globosa]|uniref:G-patch domain-containing protein n=1 Tax=Torulaspora globosa TaxID=48254 RepID=A0A7G3ZMG5_9SACH|nr:uncharacterized protein HG536_0H00760 [Torulaspora globosa]QLL34701.1 hypothetical protein HG536_0H00760 [Torulaspora globosa]
MDSKEYLISYGWKEGEALRKGGLKKPILVKHKKDKKGLGCAPGQDDSEAWWERLFDGQLKNLDVSCSSTSGKIEFKQNESVATGVSKSVSPLYRWFVRGEGLKGTIGHTPLKSSVVVASQKRKRHDKDGEELRKLKNARKEKKREKKEKKKHRREKKLKKQKRKEAESLRDDAIACSS